MPQQFSIKTGDLEPPIECQLFDGAGVAADLTAAVAVRFLVAGITLAGTASFIDKATGKVRYTWSGSDTATAGRYNAEWEIEWSGGRKQTFPSAQYIKLVIWEDLD